LSIPVVISLAFDLADICRIQSLVVTDIPGMLILAIHWLYLTRVIQILLKHDNNY